MKAMVLTAGLGTRLRPLTLERAKPAIPLLGKPLILTIIEKLRALEVKECRLNLHTLPETIKRCFNLALENISGVSFSYEPQILGTAGGLKSNESFLTDETFLMVNGDIFFEFDITKVIDFHVRNDSLATLALWPQMPPYRHTPIRIDSSYRIHSFPRTGGPWQKDGQAYVFTGITVLSRDIFRLIEPNGFSEIVTDVYEPSIIKGLKICGYPVKGYWNDLGTPASYLATQKEVFEYSGISPSHIIDDGVVVHEPQRIGPYVSIGQGSIIEEDCQIRDSILWEDCCVRRGARIKRCIVGRGVCLKGDLENRVITLNGEIPLD